MNTQVAYWLGVLQSDGKAIFYNRTRKGKTTRVFELGVTVAEKSLPMLEEFCQLSNIVINKNLKIHQLSNGQYQAHATGNSIVEVLTHPGLSIDKPKITPEWVTEKIETFGPYLAGLIDGDGDIRVKRKTTYPQCVIRIATNEVSLMLIHGIEKLLNCSVQITERKRTTRIGDRVIEGRWIEIEFYASRKNSELIKHYILPYLRLVHKKNRILYGLSLGGVGPAHQKRTGAQWSSM